MRFNQILDPDQNDGCAQKRKPSENSEELLEPSFEEETGANARQSSSRSYVLKVTLLNADMKANLCSSEQYARIDMSIVDKVTKFGYSQNLVIESLKQNAANHCSATYYLLLMNSDHLY